MKYLRITSAGEIEPEAISLMGASTKRGDSSKVGMFGSGNKFALAYFIRSGITPIIYSGTSRIEIGHVNTTFRGEPFDVITVNGKETSLTTSMGKDWECWMAIREVYANALDEGEASVRVTSQIRGKENETSFYIPMSEDVQEFHEKIDTYFSANRTPLVSNEHGDIYQAGEKGVVYRKGIRILEHNCPAIFDYNIPKIPITEDRTPKYSWNVYEGMYALISSLTEPQLIKQFLAKISDRSYVESCPSSYVSISLATCSPVWDDIMKGMYFCPKDVSGFVKDSERPMTNFIDSKLYQAFESRFGKEILPPSLRGRGAHRYKIIDECAHFTDKINKAIGICKLSKVDVDKYPIHVAEFSNKDILGEADTDGQSIILSDRIMTMGQKQITSTVIEEYIHLSTGARDETREFQDASINLCVGLMEQLSGIEL